MTVKELIELNQMIVDVVITVRKGGSVLLDQLNIGMERGIKPPHPTMVPKGERYINDLNVIEDHKKEAHYILKSINTWDDGKDYWNIKTNRIPKKWLDLEVISWEVYPASTTCGISRRNDYGGRCSNINFYGQRIDIEVLPYGEHLEVNEEKEGLNV